MIVLALAVPAVVVLLMLRGRDTVPPAAVGGGSRFGPLLLGVAAVAVVFALMTGVDPGEGESRGPMLPLAGLTLVAVVGAWVVHQRSGRTVAEGAWSGPKVVVPGAARAGRPAPPSAGEVARALGRVEARELVSGSSFGIGVGFCALSIWLFGFEFVENDGQSWATFLELAPWLAYPLTGMVVLASHRAVTRARRDGADELFETCPAGPTTRTVGFLLAAVAPVVTLVVFLIVVAVAAGANGQLHGPIGLESIGDVLGAVVLGAGGVALGVALGRWVHFGLAPVVAVVAIGFATVAINEVGGHAWNPLVPLSTAPAADGTSSVFTDRPTLWHFVWVLALTAVVAVVAVARHRRDRRMGVAAIVVVVVAAIAAIGATRPLPASAAALIADRVANPEAHQDCIAAGESVQICVFDDHRAIAERILPRVAPVAAALPADLAPLTFRQVYDDDLDDLPPEVQRRLTEADLIRPAGEIRLYYDDTLADLLIDPGFDLALAALGIPPEPDDDGLPTVLAGQARGVVAIWLATRGLDADETAQASNAAHPGSPDPFERGSLEAVDVCSEPAAVWSAQDLAAARSVLRLPALDVQRIVADGWERWSDPRTGTDQLLAALGLPGVGPFDHVVARGTGTC